MGVEHNLYICQYRVWAGTLLHVLLVHDGNAHMDVVSMAELRGIRRYELLLAGTDEEVEVAGQVNA